jgi:DNA/RNA endonuclease YhcR with UshA esterase domain
MREILPTLAALLGVILMKTFTAVAMAAVLGLGTLTAWADAAQTIDAVYKGKAKLEGKQVTVKGRVVKVNNGIMGRNFLHIQDGTGAKDSNDLSVTSTQTAVVGDQVTVVGKVTLNKDFGAGYAYPLLVEEATVTKSK